MATNDDLQIRNFVMKFNMDDDAPAIRETEVEDYADRFDFDFGGEDFSF